MNLLNDRREFLKLLGLGAGTSLLGPLMGIANASTNPSQKLLVVIANGGLRSIDFCDAFDNSSDDIDCHYDFAECESISGDWRLPPNCAALQNYVDQMTVIRNVNMETASHNIGPTIGMNGIPRTSAPAGSVIVAHELYEKNQGGSGNSPIKSLGFSNAVNAGSLEGPVFGEPEDLVELFQAPLLSENQARHQAIRNALRKTNSRFSKKAKESSIFHSWRKIFDLSDKIRNANLHAQLDPTSLAATFVTEAESHGYLSADYQKHAKRFAAAVNALNEEIAPVVTVNMEGFDTHQGSQFKLCGELSSHLSVAMSNLDMNQTTILIASDFDRTSKYNASAGTDHGLHGAVTLFGNGLKSGAFGDKGDYPGSTGTTYRRRDIWATVLKIFDVDSSSYFKDAVEISEILA